MKTTLQELKQELLDEVNLTPELRKFIGRINHIYLEKEKQAIIEAYKQAIISEYEDMNIEKCLNTMENIKDDAEQYYNQKYNK